MNTILDSSSEFATLVQQLHSSPNDPALKQAVVRRLPEMKALAQVNPLALYRLAQIYPKNSKQYQQMMIQSADLGCTNAMLAVCQFLIKTTSPSDLRRAAQYFLKIEESKDSYIINHSKSLLKATHQLAAEVDLLQKTTAVRQGSCFFTTRSHQWSDLQETSELKH